MTERFATLRPPPFDLAVAGAFLVLGLSEVWFLVGLKTGIASVGTSVVAIALAWRRVAPASVALVVSAAEFTTAWLGVPVDSHVFVIPTLVLAQYSLGAYAGLRRALVTLAICTTFASASVFMDDGPGIANLGFSVVVVGSPWLAGRMVRRRTHHAVELALHAQELERTQSEREATAVAHERARIARELHDIVAHSVSVMTIQAGAIEQIVTKDPEKARAAASSIRQTGRQALNDLRSLLGLLRAEGSSQDSLTPQPGLSDVKELVEQVRLAGVDVSLDVYGDHAPLPPAVDLSAFRVVQETLTNILKHSGAASARVVIRFEAGAVDIEITDDGSGGGGRPDGGHGLIGMQERIALYQGHLEYGDRPGGGFRVHARLPLPEDTG